MDFQTYTRFVVASFCIGGVIGSLGGIMADRIGRRTFLLTLAGIVCLGSASSSYFCWQHPTLLVYTLGIYRFFLGMCTGGSVAVVPVYLCEIAPSSRRGLIASMFNLFAALGLASTPLIAHPAIAWFSASPGTLAATLFCVPPFFACALLVLAGYLFLCESPRFLLAAGLRGDAETALRELRGQEDVSFELLFMLRQRSVARASDEPGTLVSLCALSDKAAKNRLALTCGLHAAQQLSGVTAVLFFSQQLLAFTDPGQIPTHADPAAFEGPSAPQQARLWLSGANLLVACLSSLVLVERVARKTLLLASLATCGVACAAFAVVAWVAHDPSVGFSSSYLSSGLSSAPASSGSDEAFSAALLGLLVLEVAGFELGLGPLAWLVAAELQAPEQRVASASAG